MRKFLMLTLIIILQITVKGQESQEKYLYKVGITDSIYSEVLNENRTIFIQLPYNYNADRQHKYPVVFILDGENLLPTLSDVHEYYSGGFIPEMILVGISNNPNRTRDLTPSVVTTLFGRPYNEGSGGADDFQSFLELELIPHIESKYAASDYRTLIGHSFGGLFTVYTLINKPQLFENYIAIDPSLNWDEQIVLKSYKEVSTTIDLSKKSLYMSLGGQLNNQNSETTIDNVMEDNTDFTLLARSNITFRNLIKENQDFGPRIEWEFFPEELHGTIPFPSIRNGLVKLFEWFQMENTDKFNSPETPPAELSEIIKYRSKKLENNFGYKVPPYPEDLLNVLGYMSMDVGQPEKANMYFEFGVEFFPLSPNVYDSFADYFERQKDFETAMEYVKKAYDLSPNAYYKERIQKLRKQIK